METIFNNKGGQKLCCAGYMYTKKSTKKNSIQWERTQRTGLDWGAACTDIAVHTVHVNTAMNPVTAQ